MEQNKLTEWKQQKEQGVGFRVCWLLVPCSINQTEFLFPSHIFVPLYIPLHNSTKSINTLSAGFLPVHQGSQRILLMERFSSSSDLTGLGVTPVVFISLQRMSFEKGQNDVQTDSCSHKIPCFLCWVSCCEYPHSCQLCGGRNFKFPFSYHLFSSLVLPT